MYQFDYRLLGKLSPVQAHRFRAIPLREEETAICLLSEAENPHQHSLELLLGKMVQLESCTGPELDRHLSEQYPIRPQSASQALSSQQTSESEVVRFVSSMLIEAVQIGASDIHIERYEQEARVRFRWEGQLLEKYVVPPEQYNAIVSRLKIMASLDIAERRLPQDGRIHFQEQAHSVDIRFSSMPTQYGEKCVLRLLSQSGHQLDLAQLGFQAQELQAYQAGIAAPHGLILITGPTGSGKTTTLYATLHQLNQAHRNLLTIEDPIEYHLAGVNQVQVKKAIGLDFERALRAFLRQDPDVIMVGEIRDTPTAQIGIRAALTGHLVFSTLHTNSAWDAIVRLKDMGVAPYLLAASLRMVVAQRLVRCLCPNCKQLSQEVLVEAWQDVHQIVDHFVPQGCPACHYTGYQGRKAVFEVLPILPSLHPYIKKGKNMPHDYQQQQSLPVMGQNLGCLVREGIIPVAEAQLHA